MLFCSGQLFLFVVIVPFLMCSLSFGSEVTGMATPPNELSGKAVNSSMFGSDSVDMAVSRICIVLLSF